MTHVEIRDACENDLPAVLRILDESGIDGGESFTLEEARDHFARIRQRPGFRLLVASVNGETVGTYALLIMEKLGKRGTPAGVVEDAAVLPSRQGQGIGLPCRSCFICSGSQRNSILRIFTPDG